MIMIDADKERREGATNEACAKENECKCCCDDCEPKKQGSVGVFAISKEDFAKMGPDIIGKVIAKIIEKETKGNE